MRPTLAQLSQRQPLDVIEHESIALWLRPYMRPTTWVMALYWTANLAAIAWLAMLIRVSARPVSESFPDACLGMLMAFPVLLPLHEACHALAYRALGASNVRIRYEWKKLTALCVAPGEVLNARGFAIVALAPSAILNPPLLAAALACPPDGRLQIALAGVLLFHLAAASGDLALVNFLWIQRARGVVTFDDPESPRTYFYSQP